MANGVVFGKRTQRPPDPQEPQDARVDALKPTAAPLSPNKLAAARFWQSGESDASGMGGERPSDVLFFDQPINPWSLGDLERRIDECVDADLTEITIVLSSPGGHLDCTLRLYERLVSLPIKLNTHGTGLVALAATVLFLAGSARSAERQTTFLFHPASVLPDPEDASHAEVGKSGLKTVQQELGRLYLARTRISAAMIARFGQETVIFDAGTALRLGVIDRISTFTEDIGGRRASQTAPSTTTPG